MNFLLSIYIDMRREGFKNITNINLVLLFFYYFLYRVVHFHFIIKININSGLSSSLNQQ